jgi:hypothetical protein
VENLTLAGWCVLLSGGLAALYGLHLLALRLEERGLLYYLNKKAKSSPMGCFVAFQQAIEPRTQHLLQVSHTNHNLGDEDVPGGSPKPGPGSTDGSSFQTAPSPPVARQHQQGASPPPGETD